MEHTPSKPMTPFDSMVTPSSLYTLKLMLPYLPRSMQRMLGIYIKFLEFRYTLEYFHGFDDPCSSSVFESLKEFLGPEEQEMMEQMEMMVNMMNMMKDQPDMTDMSGGMFQDMFQDMFHAPDDGSKKGENANE